MKSINLLYLFIIMMCSCDKQQISFEDIDIKIDTNYSIVIDGFISNELAIQKVKITKPVYNIDSIYFSAITNAQVYLTTMDHKYNYIASIEPGVYYSEDSIFGKSERNIQ